MTHLRLSPLSKETQYIDDPLVGQIPFRPRELSPEYTFRWLDTGASGEMAWLQPPMPEELEQRALARAIIEAQRDALVTKSGHALTKIKETVERAKRLTASEREELYGVFFTKLKETERKQLLAQLVQLELLSDRGTGFLETVPNLFESGASGVVWNFAVPNIEKVFLSSWQLQADQKQCFRIQRLSPLPDQVRSTFEIILGNGKVQYALVFTKDEAVELRHYRDKAADGTPGEPGYVPAESMIGLLIGTAPDGALLLLELSPITAANALLASRMSHYGLEGFETPVVG